MLVGDGSGLGITSSEEDGCGFRAHLLADGELMCGFLLRPMSGTEKNAACAVIVIFDFPDRSDLSFGKRVSVPHTFQHLIPMPLCMPTPHKMEEENRSNTCRDRKKNERDALFAGETSRRVVGGAKAGRPRKTKPLCRGFSSPPSLSPVFWRAVHGIIGGKFVKGEEHWRQRGASRRYRQGLRARDWYPPAEPRREKPLLHSGQK